MWQERILNYSDLDDAGLIKSYENLRTALVDVRGSAAQRESGRKEQRGRERHRIPPLARHPVNRFAGAQ